MKRTLLIQFILLVACCNAQLKSKNTDLSVRTVAFDDNWLFSKGNESGAEQPGYNDNAWRRLDLPHDWSVEDLPGQDGKNIVGPFSKASVGTRSTGWVTGGTAWYRKIFKLTKSEEGKIVYLQFDGVYMNADVWINGHHLGNHPHGYTPFYYELTPFLLKGEGENVIAVQVKNDGRNTRFYSGSGIYRHVWLTVVNPVHVDVWGVYITTHKVSRGSADVQVISTIKNKTKSSQSVGIQTDLLDVNGNIAGTIKTSVLILADSGTESKQTITIKNPLLWSVQKPNLYTAKVTVLMNNKKMDDVTTSFGVRDIKTDAVHGLLLNGVAMELKGGCVHHDNGPLGAAAIDRADERKIEILKANGYNAIRSSHYPPSPAFLQACDRLGMLVIEEAFDCWNVQKRPQDYHLYFKDWWEKDLTSMILRDRNHPSVIFWSIGNEIRDFGLKGLETRKMLQEKVHQLDPSRKMTEAVVYEPDWEKDSPPVFALLDVAGYNYQLDKYEGDHEKYPERVMYASEYHPNDMFKSWNLVEKHPYVIGDFVWAAIDYLGEAGAGYSRLDSTKKVLVENPDWPWFNANCGDIDIIGNKKPQSYYRDIVWRNKPIGMAVHSPVPEGLVENISDFGWPDEQQSWTWPGAEGKPLQVRVFSRAPLVRLLLNGKSIAEQKPADSSVTAEFKVAYQPGVLKAVNVINGKEADMVEFRTAGVLKEIRLLADRKNINADRNDLSYITVEITDEKGQLVPNADIPVQFTIDGPAEIVGVGNSNPTDMASFQRPERKTTNGKCLVIIRPKDKAGQIILKATAPGLPATTITIYSK